MVSLEETTKTYIKELLELKMIKFLNSPPFLP